MEIDMDLFFVTADGVDLCGVGYGRLEIGPDNEILYGAQVGEALPLAFPRERRTLFRLHRVDEHFAEARADGAELRA